MYNLAIMVVPPCGGEMVCWIIRICRLHLIRDCSNITLHNCVSDLRVLIQKCVHFLLLLVSWWYITPVGVVVAKNASIYVIPEVDTDF